MKVRTYNVRFGDAILISVPDRDENDATKTRHILIDVGNLLMGEGGLDDVFEPVLRDIEAILGGQRLDLYVMTHEHLDHVQGLPYAAFKLDPPIKLKAEYAWLTGSAAPGYERRFPMVRERLRIYEQIEELVAALRADGQAIPAAAEALMLNNNPRSTGACVDFLRKLADTTTYVYRGCDLTGTHPFRDASLEIWAPEEDTSAYDSAPLPLLPVVQRSEAPGSTPRLTRPKPPAGVHEESLEHFLAMKRRGYFEHLLAIDNAANNTSITFCLEWQGWRLLFPGDAELESWRMMENRGLLEAPVHFLKVSHHGSANGTPIDALQRLLPANSPDGRPRCAVVSTHPEPYPGVPDAAVFANLADRGVQILPTTDPKIGLGGCVELSFPSDGGKVGIEFRVRSGAAY